MEKTAWDHFNCVRHMEGMAMVAVDKFLCELKRSKYKLTRKSLPTCVRKLISGLQCFFAKGSEVFPQNWLLEHTIEST